MTETEGILNPNVLGCAPDRADLVWLMPSGLRLKQPTYRAAGDEPKTITSIYI